MFKFKLHLSDNEFHAALFIIAFVLIAASFWPIREAFTAFDTGLRVNAGRTVTLHYTNWCGGCKVFRPTWEAAKKQAESAGIKFSEVDEDKANTPGIESFPTVLMIDESGRRMKYTGGNNVPQLLAWMTSPRVV